MTSLLRPRRSANLLLYRSLHGKCKWNVMGIIRCRTLAASPKFGAVSASIAAYLTRDSLRICSTSSAVTTVASSFAVRTVLRPKTLMT